MSDLKLTAVDVKTVSPSVAKIAAYTKVDTVRVATLNGANGNVLPQDASAAEISRAELQDAVSRMNEYVQQNERRLDFRLDEASGQTVISVYDKSSDELIRQIPGDLALYLAQKLNDEEPPLLFSAQV